MYIYNIIVIHYTVRHNGKHTSLKHVYLFIVNCIKIVREY